MNTLIAVGAINALYLALLVWAKKRKIPPDYILALFLLLVSIAFALVFGALEYGRDTLLLFLVFSNLLYAPLFYLYVATMVDPDYRPPRRFLWHSLLFALSSVYLLAVLGARSDVEITRLFQVQPFTRRPVLFNTFFLLDFAAIPLYLGLSWRALRRHQQQIAEKFSYRKSVDYRWLRRFVAAMACTWVVIDLPLLGSRWIDPLTEPRILTLGFSLTALLVFYLGYHGFRQSTVYVPEPVTVPDPDPVVPEAEPGQRYQKSGMSEDEIQACKLRLLDYMEAERPYLDNSMTIRDLAAAIGLTEHNTSEVINVGLGMSFYEFVNGYRVEDFKRHAVSSENTSVNLLALALRCGFNSKSSFNRIFKQQTGITPSAYLKSRREADSSGREADSSAP